MTDMQHDIPEGVTPASPLPGEDIADIDGPDETDVPQTPIPLLDDQETPDGQAPQA